MDKAETWKLRWQRERAARKQAEEILEAKALELYKANQKLTQLNAGLEQQVIDRTKTLKANQKRLVSLIQNLNGGILFEDEKRDVLMTNDRFYEIFGIESGTGFNLIGANCGNMVDEFAIYFEDEQNFKTRIADLLQEKSLTIGEVIRTKDGRILERDYIPILTDEKYTGTLWHYRDVTDAFLAQQQIKKSEEKYRSIIENMKLGLLEVNTEGVVLKAHDFFCEMTGYRAEELEGINPENLLLEPEYRPVIRSHNEDRKKGISDVYEVRVKRKDGRVIWVLISGAPFYGLDGKVKGSIGIHLDITDRKKLNEDLMKAKIKAEEAQKAEKEFLAHMSHEIRTPLNAIIGMSHLLYDTNPSPQQKSYLDTLQNASGILHRLISDILDFSKIEAGAIEVNYESFNLEGMVRSLKQTFALKLEKEPVDLILNFDKQITNLVIGDELLLQRILLNLIGNAVKFTAQGSITIEVTLEEQFGKDILVGFKVRDTGIGIPEDRLEVIFQDFKQASSSTSIKYGGTGLGLAITKQLVDLMDGLIWVESEVGKGTCFTVELPFKDSGIESVEVINSASAKSQIDNDFKLLVVEDNHMNRAYIGSLLKKWNINFEVAEDGIEGVEKAKDDPFNLIIMDIRMPRMNGYDATIAIRNHSNVNKKTPIVALTASAMESEKHNALAIGMNDFLTKPFTPDQLKKLLNDYMSGDVEMEELTTEKSFYLADLDSDYLYSFYEDDYESASEMFEMFLNEIVPELEDLKIAFENKDYVLSRSLVHKMKPTFAMVGMTWVTNKFSNIEQFLDKEATNEAENLWQETKTNYEQYLPVVEAQLEQLKNLI